MNFWIYFVNLCISTSGYIYSLFPLMTLFSLNGILLLSVAFMSSVELHWVEPPRLFINIKTWYFAVNVTQIYSNANVLSGRKYQITHHIGMSSISSVLYICRRFSRPLYPLFASLNAFPVSSFKFQVKFVVHTYIHTYILYCRLPNGAFQEQLFKLQLF